MGRAVFAMLRMLGWERSLTRISRGLQSGSNFLSARTRFLDNGILEMVFEVMPEFRAAFGAQPGIDPYFMNGTMDGMMALVDRLSGWLTAELNALVGLDHEPLSVPACAVCTMLDCRRR